MPIAAIHSPDSDKESFRRLRAAFPDLELRFADAPEALPAALAGAEILVSSNRYYTEEAAAQIRAHGGALRWVQFVTSGIDKAVANGLPPGCVVTNVAGLRAFCVAEQALALMLGLVRRLRDAEAARMRGAWERDAITPLMDNLAGKTLLVVGVGAIGQDIARKAKAFDMTVVGVSRSATPPPPFDRVAPREALAAEAAACDLLVVAANYEAATHHLISRQVIAALRPHALLVNIARGLLVDEEALVEALQARRIGGAGLDVTAEEPLPEGHPLWTCPNTLVTPHVAGAGCPNPHASHASLFADNLRLWLAGKPLERVVLARS